MSIPIPTDTIRCDLALNVLAMCLRERAAASLPDAARGIRSLLSCYDEEQVLRPATLPPPPVNEIPASNLNRLRNTDSPFDPQSDAVQIQNLTMHNLTARHFTKHKPEIFNISFSLNRGEFLAVLGPSGSGKSSILSALLNKMYIEEGEIYVNAQVCSRGFSAWVEYSIMLNITFIKGGIK